MIVHFLINLTICRGRRPHEEVYYEYKRFPTVPARPRKNLPLGKQSVHNYLGPAFNYCGLFYG